MVPAIPHAVDLLRGHKESVTATHKALQEKGPVSQVRGQHSYLHNIPFRLQ